MGAETKLKVNAAVVWNQISQQPPEQSTMMKKVIGAIASVSWQFVQERHITEVTDALQDRDAFLTQAERYVTQILIDRRPDDPFKVQRQSEARAAAQALAGIIYGE